MIVNPGKFQGIIIDQKKQDHTAEYISIDQKNIKTSSSAKLLGVLTDDKLNFNLHIKFFTQILITVHLSGCFLAQSH